MEASLDTNVIIHLYQANRQDILFSRFSHLYAHEQISSVEMTRRASHEVNDAFQNDIINGKIEVITQEHLREMGILSIYQQHYKDNMILYDYGDLGIFALVTDDTKQYGPHYTLIREQDTSVSPFTFYELLFLDYLEGIIPNPEELNMSFEQINQKIDRPMAFAAKQKEVIRRFFKGSEKDNKWMADFCTSKGINVRLRLALLYQWLKGY